LASPCYGLQEAGRGFEDLSCQTKAMLVVLVLSLVAILAGYAAWLWSLWRRPDPLDQLGVRSTYPGVHLPTAKIEAYCEIKEQLRRQHKEHVRRQRPDADSHGNLWMSLLPPEAKDMLKFRLMQRAIGDMAALQKVDADARGYWRLFSKGVITRKFWNSVVDVEKQLSEELENVKAEAAGIEPTQDPQGIISEAMHFVLRYGDKLPSASEIASSADALTDLMRSLPPPGHPDALRGMPGMPPGGMPGMPGLPPGMPGMPCGPGIEQKGGVDEACNWRQDTDEVEVTVSVPNNATKAEIKVVIQAQALKVMHSGSVVAEGKLGGKCHPEGSTWTLGKGRVVLSLEKADPRPWKTLFAEAKA